MENEIPQATTPTPPPTQTPPLPQPVPQNKLPKSILLTVLGLVVVLASLFAGIQIGKTQTLKQSSISQPTPTESVSPTPTSEINPDTYKDAGWKTYKNTDLEFSIMYPNDWFIEEQGPLEYRTIRFQNYDPTTAPGRGYNSVEDKGKWGFVISKTNFSSKPKNILELKQELQQPGTDCGYMGDPAGTLIVSEEIESFAGDYATFSRKEECSELQSIDESETVFVLDKKGKVIAVEIILDYIGQEKLFYQILSTIKFTDQNSKTTCQYQGKTYQEGESLKIDSCNSCSCSGGEIACTLIACE